MDEVRRAVAEGAIPPPTTVRRARHLFAAAAGTFAMVAAILLTVMMLFPSRSAGWAEVTQPIYAAKWIVRPSGTLTVEKGRCDCHRSAIGHSGR